MDPLRIIAVDDDPFARTALVTAVHALGYECIGACDGVEALELHARFHADVIVSDWAMPHMDGAALCQRVRVLDGDAHHTHFVFTTGFDDRLHYLHGMAVGADDYLAKPIDLDDLGARLGAAARIVLVQRRLCVRNAKLRRDGQRMAALALVDPLTTVGSRRRMDDDLATVWARSERYGEPYCLAICDVDLFKRYNDEHGHVAGDQALRRIAQALRSALRREDTVYRYGGEEFLVLLPMQTIGQAALALQRARRAVERDATADGEGHITVSIGVAELAHALDGDVTSWVGRADRALYEAKALGRDRIALAERETRAASKDARPRSGA